MIRSSEEGNCEAAVAVAIVPAQSKLILTIVMMHWIISRSEASWFANGHGPVGMHS